MLRWIARYEEGYVTTDGQHVTLVDELHARHPWSDPAEARRHWAARPDLAATATLAYGNGLQQSDDVSTRPEFRALGVVEIWRRVTFRPLPPSESLPRSSRLRSPAPEAVVDQ